MEKLYRYQTQNIEGVQMAQQSCVYNISNIFDYVHTIEIGR